MAFDGRKGASENSAAWKSSFDHQAKQNDASKTDRIRRDEQSDERLKQGAKNPEKPKAGPEVTTQLRKIKESIQQEQLALDVAIDDENSSKEQYLKDVKDQTDLASDIANKISALHSEQPGSNGYNEQNKRVEEAKQKLGETKERIKQHANKAKRVNSILSSLKVLEQRQKELG